MGKSSTPTYRVEAEFSDGTGTKGAWQVKAAYGIPGNGQPTAANLAKWVEALESSSRPGGCNAHIGPLTVFNARIIRQSTRQTVATYRGPSFVVV